ncbi:TPA: hypothetical protein ACOQ43_000513 [Bacillus cereus]
MTILMVLKKEAFASFLDIDGLKILLGVLYENAKTLINKYILQRLKKSCKNE